MCRFREKGGRNYPGLPKREPRPEPAAKTSSAVARTARNEKCCTIAFMGAL